MRCRILGGVSMFAMVIVACSSSTTASPDDACNSYTTAVCDKIKTCFPEIFNAQFTDTPTCAARQKISCLNTLSAKGTGTTTSDFTACGGAITGADCGGLSGAGSVPPDACKPKAGAGAAGSACQDNSQCASTYCKFGTSSCGACSNRVDAGAKCDSGEDCSYGLVCGATQTCVKPGDAGATCSNDTPCSGTLVCKTSTPTATSGTCAAPGGAGDACTGSDCDGTKALFCNAQSKVCQTVTFAAPGSACGNVGGNATACQGNGAFCATTGVSQTGTCKAGLNDGDACGAAGQASCQSPARCVNAVCTLPTTCG